MTLIDYWNSLEPKARLGVLFFIMIIALGVGNIILNIKGVDK